MPGRLARMLLAFGALWIGCSAGGCVDLNQRTVADDSLLVIPVDGGTLEDVVREAIAECRLVLLDAGRVGAPPKFDYCSIAWFYEGCPLRVCAEELARKIEPRCPPRDAGVDSTDSRLCETVVWPFLPAEP